MSKFKPLLADALIECLAPIRKRFFELQKDTEYVKEVIQEGADRTLEEAERRMELIKTVIGLLG